MHVRLSTNCLSLTFRTPHSDRDTELAQHIINVHKAKKDEEYIRKAGPDTVDENFLRCALHLFYPQFRFLSHSICA